MTAAMHMTKCSLVLRLFAHRESRRVYSILNTFVSSFIFLTFFDSFISSTKYCVAVDVALISSRRHVLQRGSLYITDLLYLRSDMLPSPFATCNTLFFSSTKQVQIFNIEYLKVSILKPLTSG